MGGGEKRRVAVIDQEHAGGDGKRAEPAADFKNKPARIVPALIAPEARTSEALHEVPLEKLVELLARPESRELGKVEPDDAVGPLVGPERLDREALEVFEPVLEERGKRRDEKRLSKALGPCEEELEARARQLVEEGGLVDVGRTGFSQLLEVRAAEGKLFVGSGGRGHLKVLASVFKSLPNQIPGTLAMKREFFCCTS